MDPISNIKGLFQRGSLNNTPEDHLLDGINLEFPPGEVITRKGVELDLTTGAILRMVLYKRRDEATRILILIDGGHIYDSTSLSAPIITIAGMTDFSAAFFYNRAYISPHDGIKGLANEYVRVYDGTTIRLAAGSQPTGTMTAANSASSGKVDAGTHVLAVVIVSPSGHLSKPGPVVFASVNATGGKKIDLTGIPTGPSGTPERRIIATRAIPDYDGNQFGQEYFFVPNGAISNNVDTTFTVDFYDSELQDDVSYLFEMRENIPAGLHIGSYEGRMVVGNISTDRNALLVSKVNEPESFDLVDDIVIVDPTEASGITNTVEHHGMLVIMKSFRSYTTRDNNAEPSTWEVLPFDKAIGTEVHGVATILDSTGATVDRFIMASRSGLILYDGTFREPDLTWKIKNQWDRISPNYYHTIQSIIDPLNKRIYVAIPIDEGTSPNHLLYGDYSDGLDYENIKWTVWTFPFVHVTSILIDLINNVPVLKIGTRSQNVYRKTTTRLNDYDNAILSYVQFAHLPQAYDGIIRHYNWFRAKIVGAGNCEVTVRGQDDTNQQTYASFALTTSGNDVERKINFEGERCSVRLWLDNINEWMSIKSFYLNFKDKWRHKPQ